MIGLIVPPAHGQVPNDASTLFPQVDFCATGMSIREMTEASFAAALPRLESAVSDLIADGASAISLMGTSLTFFRGRAGNEQLLERLEAVAEGRPCSTMATAVVRALREVDARRVSVLSAYSPDMVRRLNSFLAEHGIKVVAEDHLGIDRIDSLSSVTTDLLSERGARLLESAPHSEALVVSCGGLDTLEAILAIEAVSDAPVVSSSQAGLWDIVGRAGLVTASPHASRLLQRGRETHSHPLEVTRDRAR